MRKRNKVFFLKSFTFVRYKCSTQILTITAMLSVDANLFYRPRDKLVHADNAHKMFHVPGGDQLTLLKHYNQWKATDYSVQWTFENFLQSRSLKRARDVRDQLKALCERIEIPVDEEEEEDTSALTPEKTEAVLKVISLFFDLVFFNSFFEGDYCWIFLQYCKTAANWSLQDCQKWAKCQNPSVELSVPSEKEKKNVKNFLNNFSLFFFFFLSFFLSHSFSRSL